MSDNVEQRFETDIPTYIMGTLNGNVSTEISETVIAEKIKTHFMYSTYLLHGAEFFLRS